MLALIADSGFDALTSDLIFKGRTARAITQLLESAQKADAVAHQSALEASYPLTEAQMGVYLECVREPESMMYNLPMVCQLPESIDPNRFAAAAKAAFEGHRALGVRIVKGSDGLPCMIPGDFTAEIPQERYDSLEAASAAFIRPFDLENDRLFRAEIAFAEGRHYFLFDVHHIVFDGTSVKVLIDDIAAAYDGRTLSEEALTLFDIAAWRRTCEPWALDRKKDVAVLIPRCEYIAIASLGVLKAGGGYLPLDPTYPPERLNLMVKDSGAMLLITTPELKGVITDEFTGQCVMLDEIPRMADNGKALEPTKPSDLFIMLYTSGSTGVPKGVMLEHGNLNTFCAWHRKTYGMDERARIAAYASYGFDACMHDLYPALTAGSAIYIISEQMRLNLPALHRYFGENGINHAFMTTQIGRQFAQMRNPGQLRLLTMGGEKLVPFAPTDIPAGNGYGPTECTIFSTMYPVKALYRDVPIGKTLDNLRLYVVDKAGRRLPVGAAGELWIAGPQVGRGYLNRPEQTAAAFTDNPFASETKYARLYHTGDIVRFMPDGNVQFIGRRDAQVKVRGFRIELTEVEEVIHRFPGIRDATVAAYDAPSGGKYSGI